MRKNIIRLFLPLALLMLCGCGKTEEIKSENQAAEPEAEVVLDLIFDIPEGFQEDEDRRGLYLPIEKYFEKKLEETTEDADAVTETAATEADGVTEKEEPAVELIEDFSCIYYEETPADDRYELLDQDSIKELMEEMYAKVYGIEAAVEVKDFHKFRKDGQSVYRIETELEMDDRRMQMIEYVFLTKEKNLSVTYLQNKDAGWEKAFEQSAETITVRK